jgi:polysaccharide deacetylase family protein (PEP-CTERM system associated)
MKPNIFSIDVEEWFHFLETDCLSENPADWDNYPSRVAEVFPLMLAMLRRYNVHATIFFLGWVAEKYPALVESAHSQGHEIAAHGYYHELIYNQTYAEFYEDLQKTKEMLESITGEKVLGYRAPGFSITDKTLWAYKALMDLGFRYSASVFPAARAHGSYPDFGLEPKVIRHENKSIVEFPMTILNFPLTAFSCFGGGYFRLFPLFWHNIACSLISRRNRPLILYIHPRDMDPDQPRFNLPAFRRMKSYINIKGTRDKLEHVLQQRTFAPFVQVLDNIKVQELAHTELRIPAGWGSAHLSD